MVVGARFALEEAARIASGGGVFFFVLYRQGHEVGIFFGVRCAGYGGEEHGFAHFHHNGAVGLLGELAGFDFNGAAIA